MKKIAIVPNQYKDKDFIFTKEIASFLLGKNRTVLLDEKFAEFIPLPVTFSNPSTLFASDLLIVLGGDGTFLSVARHAATFKTPLLGINLGTLGFLTDVEKKDTFRVLEKILSSNYTIEKRIMLEAEILSANIVLENKIALNEISIAKGMHSRIIKMDIYVNDIFYDHIRADGIIISTPTGSTAYNLSAGGPIIKPDIDVFAITPICSHHLHSRSSIVSAEDTIKIELCKNLDADIYLSLDGQIAHQLQKDDVVMIKKSSFTTKMIKTKQLGFYDILRKKMKEL